MVVSPAMNLSSELKTWVLLKTMVKTLRLLNEKLNEQNVILKRIADRIAPEVLQEPVEQGIRSVDYSEDVQQALLIEFTEKHLRDLGRPPTDDEMIEHLDEIAERTAKARHDRP